ncbi:MAG TPA: FAD-linked oxidase C-terminal domain-containing protein [Thermoanaerobaculia bacterium]|nr:FAD-linked oxidase C-terminal domain-containing protein [Thermoanaerobaculia bacterium]
MNSASLRREQPQGPDVDAAALASALRRKIRGEVRFDDGSRALYATDASNYRQVPIGVVVPRDTDDILETLALCRSHGAPVLPRGGGTSLAGQCCNVAVVLDTSKYLNRVLEVDPARRLARVEPGAILDDLRDQAEKHHLTFGPDPATHSHCTLGGMIGNNSCGVHSVLAGKTDENVERLEITTYDGLRVSVGKTSEAELARIIAEGGRRGEIYAGLKQLALRHASGIRERYPKIPRRVSGYNLPYLLPENGFDVARALVGSEGTCVFVLEATLRLVKSPRERCLLVLGFHDVYAAADRVPEILTHRPIGLEGFDDRLVADMRVAGLHSESLALLPEGGGWLLAEFGGATREEAERAAQGAAAGLRSGADAISARLFREKDEQRRIWRVRESALGATAHVPGKPPTWEGWEDSAVSPEKLGAYLRDLRGLLEKHRYGGVLYGHFGQACVHTRTDFDLVTAEGIRRFRAFLSEAADLVVRYGGSLSGEHGDGQSRAELLPKMFGPEIVSAFREFKAIWDPQGKMNPGKVVDAYGPDENLRLPALRREQTVRTHFQFPQDGGDFSEAVLRCVGVGACRRLSGGTMCPSFMVTREEMHSTRGRARMLFEMLQGEAIRGRWRDRRMREALDLCLACKGCKSDCPVGVDMATYKAEFLAHYYEGRLRPIAAYTMGLLHCWAPVAARVPRFVNFLTQTPGFSGALKAAAGIAQRREMPAFARQTFREWFANRPSEAPGGKPPVLLWPDTFNNHFHPETARAAVRVLEAAGFDVTIPAQPLCCGRPLYDYGMLDLARKLLREILERLREPLREGIPVVVLEPSCAAVFRDELTNLFPEDLDARKLKDQTFLLPEFLERRAAGWTAGRLSGKAIAQTHCHEKAIWKTTDREALLRRIGLEVEQPNDGCCGMAGAFGFERQHYALSVQIGERALAPAVRRTSPDTLVIADGFSCRQQVRQLTGRKALHTAEILEAALRV